MEALLWKSWSVYVLIRAFLYCDLLMENVFPVFFCWVDYVALLDFELNVTVKGKFSTPIIPPLPKVSIAVKLSTINWKLWTLKCWFLLDVIFQNSYQFYGYFPILKIVSSAEFEFFFLKRRRSIMQHRGTVQHVCGLISVRHIHSSYSYTKQFIMSDATFFPFLNNSGISKCSD